MSLKIKQYLLCENYACFAVSGKVICDQMLDGFMTICHATVRQLSGLI